MMGIFKRLTNKSGGVGIVYGGSEQSEEIAYCHRCLEMANIRSELGNNVYLPVRCDSQVSIIFLV